MVTRAIQPFHSKKIRHFQHFYTLELPNFVSGQETWAPSDQVTRALFPTPLRAIIHEMSNCVNFIFQLFVVCLDAGFAFAAESLPMALQKPPAHLHPRVLPGWGRPPLPKTGFNLLPQCFHFVQAHHVQTLPVTQGQEPGTSR